MGLFQSDLQFTTDLSITDCQVRLEEATGVSVWKIKSLLTRQETGELGFLLYEKSNLWTTLLQGPALLGSIKPEGTHCKVYADYKPYLGWRWYLGAATISFVVLIVYSAYGAYQIEIVQYVLFAIIITIVILVSQVANLLMRHPTKQLATKLAVIIEAVE